MSIIYILNFLTIIFLKVMITPSGISDGSVSTSLEENPKEKITYISFNERVKGRNFYSVQVDANNTVWFLTEAGIVSYNGDQWISHNSNRKLSNLDIKDFTVDISSSEQRVWIATSKGLLLAPLPIHKKSTLTTYITKNSGILSNNVRALAAGYGPVKWIGTEKGISAFGDNGWLTNSYQRKYRETMFTEFPITSMATTPSGDSLFVCTDGAGVARVFRDDVDAVSGASEYAQWGPIDIPSDNVYSICIAPDGTQWFGTDRGVARHAGNQTLSDWTVFNTDNGLINNYVQSIAIDNNARVWFGTSGGLSCFDGTTWRSYSTADGLNSNNILCIAVDNNNYIWCGTENGVICYNGDSFIIFK